MNQTPQQPDQDLDGLDVFERQLRTLAPREAKFRLPQPPTVAEKPVRTLKSSDKREWALKLLVAWSLGAAAGIGGTLLTLRFAKSVPAKKPVAQVESPTVTTDQRLVPLLQTADKRDANSSALNLAMENDPPQLGSRPNGSSTVAAVNATAPASWPMFLGQALSFNVQAERTLTPIGPVTSLGPESSGGAWRDFPYAEREYTTSATAEGNEDSSSSKPREMMPEPAKLQHSPPTSQRDLLRDLLGTLGAI